MQEDKSLKKLRILALSDTHVNHYLIKTYDWPNADVFVYAGDLTITSTRQEFADFRKFIAKLPYKHKLVVAGNHDFGLEPSQEIYEKLAKQWEVPDNKRVNTAQQRQKLKSVCTLLEHDSVNIEGVTFFGTPHVWIGYEMAFTAPFIKKQQIWKKVPKNVDVLVTHIPPFGIKDLVHDKNHAGCKRLLSAVQKIQPKVHIFGHIHESYGNILVGKTHYYNVCYYNEYYKPQNKPVLIEIDIPAPPKKN